MPNLSFWSGVTWLMESAAAAPVAITGISKPPAPADGVVTHGGADPADGAIVRVTALGMHQVNGILARVANSGGGTFELEGVETETYGDFTSGSFEVLTIDIPLQDIIETTSTSGGEPEFTDATPIGSLVRVQVPTIVSPVSVTASLFWDPSDPSFIQLTRVSKAIGKRAHMVIFPSQARFLMNGYVSMLGVPTGDAQDVVKSNLSIQGEGVPQVYPN